jgi:tetratricopeptide (TPR) repeat protein
MAAAKALEEAVSERLLRVEVPPMADWLEGFLSMKVHALIRFGRWSEVLAEPFPSDPELYCVTTAMLRYARGVASAATGDVASAEEERARFHEAVARVPASRTVFNNRCLDILAVGAAMLDGELEYRQRNFDAAFAHLRSAVARDDSLPYDEPWAWMQPVRHALGALLLEQGRVEEALETYRDDLGLSGTLPRALQHPNNVWSLHGYVECLETMGRTDEALAARPVLALAKARADVAIDASCFCRLDRNCCE